MRVASLVVQGMVVESITPTVSAPSVSATAVFHLRLPRFAARPTVTSRAPLLLCVQNVPLNLIMHNTDQNKNELNCVSVTFEATD